MGWPNTPPVRVTESKAEKLWGRGRVRQLLTRLVCRVRGHDWRDWTYDWPEYEADELTADQEMTGEWTPGDGEVLLWYRGCMRGRPYHGCGTIQSAKTTLKRRMELPS